MKDALNLMIHHSGLSQLKKSRVHAQLCKMMKIPKWQEKVWEVEDWIMPLCHARLRLGYLDWMGWGHRLPRDGIIDFDYPWYVDKPVDKLLILAEQGLGDEVLFASCFKEVMAKEVTVECDARLKSVFERSFPQIEFIARKHVVEGTWQTDNSWTKGRHFDAMVLAGELPTWYRRKKADFPKGGYLVAEPDKKYAGRIGISWRGRQGGYPAQKFKDHVPDGLSLQYNTAYHPFEIPDVDLTSDIEGVFSIVAGLRRVVSVPTSIVHIAGSLGVPTDVIMPPIGYKHGGFDESVHNGLNWRWGLPWHSSVKVFNDWREYEKA
jgi:hypothetical protein